MEHKIATYIYLKSMKEYIVKFVMSLLKQKKEQMKGLVICYAHDNKGHMNKKMRHMAERGQHNPTSANIPRPNMHITSECLNRVPRSPRVKTVDPFILRFC